MHYLPKLCWPSVTVTKSKTRVWIGSKSLLTRAGSKSLFTISQTQKFSVQWFNILSVPLQKLTLGIHPSCASPSHGVDKPLEESLRDLSPSRIRIIIGFIKCKILSVETKNILSAYTHKHMHTHTCTHACMHTYACTHTQAFTHMSILTIQNLIYTQLKTGSNQRLETDKDSKIPDEGPAQDPSDILEVSCGDSQCTPHCN